MLDILEKNRFDIENFIFISVICSKSKPNYSAILTPLMKSLKDSFLYSFNFLTIEGKNGSPSSLIPSLHLLYNKLITVEMHFCKPIHQLQIHSVLTGFCFNKNLCLFILWDPKLSNKLRRAILLSLSLLKMNFDWFSKILVNLNIINFCRKL